MRAPRTGAKMALSGFERVEATRKRVEAAVRPDEAQRIVCRAYAPYVERDAECRGQT